MRTKCVGGIAVAVLLAGFSVSASAQSHEQYKDQVRVKKALADSMTPEQYEAHVEKMAKFLAEKAANPTPKAAPGTRAAGDTCTAATDEVSALPFNVSSTTAGMTDDYKLPPDTTNPTCTAPVTCTGRGPAASLPRGAVYTGTGTGPDNAFRIKTDANCSLSITMTPTGGQDLALQLFLNQCSSSLADCGCSSDTGVANGSEVITLDAVANEQYFVVVDGYSTGATPPGPSGPYNLSITTTGTCSLVPVDLQNFSID